MTVPDGVAHDGSGPGPPRSARLRRRGADVLYALAAGLDLVVSTTVSGLEHGPRWALVAAGLNLPAVVVLVGWRRSHPFLTLAVMAPAVTAGLTQVLLPLGLVSLAIRRRDWALPLAAVTGWLAFTVGGGWRGPGAGSNALVGAVTCSLAVAFGAYVGARRDLLTTLRERAEQAEATALLLQRQARLAERTRIAREMHDVVAHRISLVALHAGGLEVNPGVGPEQVERAAALIGTTARQALDDLREVLGVLRSDPEVGALGGPDDAPDDADLAPQPRLEDLPRLVAASAAAGVPVTFSDERPDGHPDDATVDEVVGRTVYRVVQEALTNVHKHARAAATRVVLRGGTNASLDVEVTNVRPAAANTLVPGSGTGLVGLRERVALAGGTLRSGGLPGGGWRVRATFPAHPDRPADVP